MIHIVGGGLAGSEAAWQIAEAGVEVVLHEMRPVRKTDVHQSEDLAELVCSNSFRSDDKEANCVGVLHEEMRILNSLIMKAGAKAQVPAGSALAVDRDMFSAEVTQTLANHPKIKIVREAVNDLPDEGWGQTIIATGPLTSPELSAAIKQESGEEHLAFFDAIAPIVHRDSIDFSKAWYQSRYDKVGPGGDGKDYINLPLDQQQYEDFIDALISSEKADFAEWEKDTPYFEACLPIEVMAERGRETLRFGPLKPVGLTNPHQPEIKAHAVVQLRQDNKLGTLYNLVGFQTKMKYGAQVEVLRRLPGLENAEFARLGGIHRNTFIQSPKLLDNEMRLKSKPWLRFVGQMTGVEGYVESAASGLLAARYALAEHEGRTLSPIPQTCAHGALISHITGEANPDTFQPMNVNFGLMPPPDLQIMPNGKRRKLKGRERKAWMAERALTDFRAWVQKNSLV